MLNNIWKGPYILFMYFFVVFLMIFLYVLIKLKRNLLLSPPTQKYTLIPMFPKYLASQKKIRKQEREWKWPTENSPQEIQSGSKKENENGPLKDKCMARSGDGHGLRWIPNLETCGGPFQIWNYFLSANRPDRLIPCG